MGRMALVDMLENAKQETALLWHLQSNHYPPVDSAFLPIAHIAIEHANNGEWDTTIEMPNGKTLTTSEIVEGLHLDDFIQYEEEWEEFDEDWEAIEGEWENA